jgi:hypothetical protein
MLHYDHDISYMTGYVGCGLNKSFSTSHLLAFILWLLYF